jgi:hypothetical protein
MFNLQLCELTKILIFFKRWSNLELTWWGWRGCEVMQVHTPDKTCHKYKVDGNGSIYYDIRMWMTKLMVIETKYMSCQSLSSME